MPGGASLDLPLTTKNLVNENHGSCGGDKITLTQALEVSCNVSFGSVGLDIGDDAIRATANKFGWGTRTFHDLDDDLTRQAVSRFPANPDKPQTALSAIGQFDVAATPLQMAMVGAGIANNGTVMKPYLVDEIKSPKLSSLSKTDPSPMPDQPAMSALGGEGPDPDDGRRWSTTAPAPPPRSPGSRWPARPAPPRARPTGRRTPGSCRSRPPTTPRSPSPCWSRTPGVARDQISGSGLAAPIAKAVMEAVMGK